MWHKVVQSRLKRSAGSRSRVCAQRERNEHCTKPGLWLSLVRRIEGAEAEVVFPGSELAWRALHSNGSRDLIGKFVVFASLRDNVKNGTIVNIVDGVTT
jgi:hypothetical protein